MPRDPICNMQVEGDGAVTLEHKGKTLYFCSEGCRESFISDHPSGDDRGSFELIIIGGGPAGLTAAVYAATMKIDAFVITDDIGGQAVDSTKIKNYMGYDFITGPELAQKFKEQLLHSNYIRHLMAEVENVTVEKDGFCVTVSRGQTFRARAVIAATGMSRRKLGVPGEEEFQRKGVFYGNVQDLSFVQGKDAAVIGGGNSAMQIAENLATVARMVHIISDLPLGTTADAKTADLLVARHNVDVYERYKVEEIAGDETVNTLTIRQLGSSDPFVLDVDGVFIAVGMHPNAAAVADLAALNERGEILIRQDCSTLTPGFFAAGDVTDAYGKRIIIAAGEGAKAALAARQFLLNRRKTKVRD